MNYSDMHFPWVLISFHKIGIRALNTPHSGYRRQMWLENLVRLLKISCQSDLGIAQCCKNIDFPIEDFDFRDFE